MLATEIGDNSKSAPGLAFSAAEYSKSTLTSIRCLRQKSDDTTKGVELLKLEPLLDLVLSRLAAKQETIGIVLLGGLGVRGLIDRFSDLDLAVFVANRNVIYMPPFSFEVRHEGVLREFNVTQHVMDTADLKWDSEKRSAYRNGIIVHDPTGITAEYLWERIAPAEGEYTRRLIVALNQAQWRGVRHSRAAAARGYPETAHCLINEGVRLLIDAVFHINKIDLTHSKWSLMTAECLEFSVPLFRKRVGEAVLVLSFDNDDIERRVGIIESLIEDLKRLAIVRDPTFPADTYNHWARFLSGRQLQSDNIVDRLCVALERNFSDEEIIDMRGSLSIAVLKGPLDTTELIDIAKSDELIDDTLVERMRAALCLA